MHRHLAAADRRAGRWGREYGARRGDPASHAGGAAPPTLRLYRWRPACLSLGRFQRSGAIDRAACARAGVAIVRRPSGGRALLHDAELTYAIIARADHPLFGGQSILATYRQISLALLAGLRRLGVAAELTPVAKRRKTKDERLESSSIVVVDAQFGGLLRHAGGLRADCGRAQAGRQRPDTPRRLLLQHGAHPADAARRALAALLRTRPTTWARR